MSGSSLTMGSLETTRPRSVETAFTVLAAAVEAVVVEVESAAAVEAVVVEVDSVRRSRQGIQTTGIAVMVSMGVTCSVLTVDAQYTSFATTGLPPLQVNFLYLGNHTLSQLHGTLTHSILHYA